MSESSIWDRDSVKRAEQWIDSAISQGYSATRGLEAYREGGGSIRSSWWYEAFGEKAQSVYRSDGIFDLPDNFTIPERMWTKTGADYTDKYIWKTRVRPILSGGALGSELAITLETDDKFTTLAQWKADMLDLLQRYSGMEDTTDFEIIEGQFLKRV